MEPTTLVTFLFRAPASVRAVELLGSWDNFHRPYRMHHDRRRGTGFFSGCFKFQNIVFDGDARQHWIKPRSGGLKQGGTYWYYYRLNDDVEAYDDQQPYTTSCPLLPGQTVNVIDVPLELVELPVRCHSAHGDIVGTLAQLNDDSKHTLDPANKYVMLEPPPVSKVHVRCRSDDALNGRLEGGRPWVGEANTLSPVSTSRSKRDTYEFTEEMYVEVSDEGVSRPTSQFSSQPYDSAGMHDGRKSIITPPQYPDEDPLPLSDQPHVHEETQSSPEFVEPVFSSSPSKLPVLEEEISPDAHLSPLHEASSAEDESISLHRYDTMDNINSDSLDVPRSSEHRPPSRAGSSQRYPSLGLDTWNPLSTHVLSMSPTSQYSEDSDIDQISTDNEDGLEVEGDIMSPTFSAATISTGGNNTPFRLSANLNNIQHQQSHETGDENDHRSLDDVSERLHNIQSDNRPSSAEEQEGTQSPSRHNSEYTTTRAPPPLLPPLFLQNYSLTTSTEHPSQGTVILSSSPRSKTSNLRNPLELSLPTWMLHRGEEEEAGPGAGDEGEHEISMVDAIFNELGYLDPRVA